MSGNVDFGYDGDEPFRRILHYFPDFFAGVAAPVGNSVEAAVAHAHDGLAALRTDFRKPGTFPDGNAPALVVGKVPVEVVDVVKGEQVDVFLYEVHAVEVAADVQHHAPVVETGRVCNPYLRENRAGGSFRGGQRLAQSLHSVEDARLVGSFYHDAAIGHVQRIAFRFLPFVSQGQADKVSFRQAVGHLHGISGALLQEVGEEAGGAFRLSVARVIGYHGAAVGNERTSFCRTDFAGKGNHCIIGLKALSAARSKED